MTCFSVINDFPELPHRYQLGGQVGGEEEMQLCRGLTNIWQNGGKTGVGLRYGKGIIVRFVQLFRAHKTYYLNRDYI